MTDCSSRVAIEPDTKDWTWVLERPCPDCGFDAGSVDLSAMPQRIIDNAAAWRQRLRAEDVDDRPAAQVWSPLEYACHVRDVHRVFGERVHRMLCEDRPRFADWGQDAAAVESGYGSQDAAVVSDELTRAAGGIAQTFVGVQPGQWGRSGIRSNGSELTVDSIARYYLHDLVHHAYDVGLA